MRAPVPVDAIPDIGENQQIVFTQWPGRSPQDVEDQITYPLTVSLLGIPGVKSIRSNSMFGFSNIYIIFEDDIDFYWSRSRILEKLNSLPANTLPADVKPALGPDATSLGQVFWYTLEGRNAKGEVAGGWDLHELRTIQDWYVRFALLSVPGVSEVASIGGFTQEYQVDLDPDLMRANDVSLNEVIAAVRSANLDVGAQTIEVNRVEYIIRGLGFIKHIDDLESAVIKLNNNVPIFVSNVARVTLGPAPRQGALDKNGTETVGGVVVVRYGDNPYDVIRAVKRKIAEISPGLPQKKHPDGTVSRVQIIPYYDRTGLIEETLATLQKALTNEVLVTVVVIIIMLANLRVSLIVSGMLPLIVLACFIGMKIFRVDANIVALSGIAIAIGTMVDMGVVLTENIYRHLNRVGPDGDSLRATLSATREVSGAVITAVLTTVVSFLPVFTMEGAAGKLFQPLAFTKTIALIAAALVALWIVPPLARTVLTKRKNGKGRFWIVHEGLIYAGALAAFLVDWRIGLALAVTGGYHLIYNRLPPGLQRVFHTAAIVSAMVGVTVLLAMSWMPLGVEQGLVRNVVFTIGLIAVFMGGFRLFQIYYPKILRWCLDHKRLFVSIPSAGLLFGLVIWLGFDSLFGWMPRLIRESPPAVYLTKTLPGLGKEFMPPLDEGAFLFMPTSMPHASIGEMLDVLKKQNRSIRAIPEIEYAVGKLGRVDSPLDPAPISMIETLVSYKTEYLCDAGGKVMRFEYKADENDYFRNSEGIPVPAADGQPYVVRGRFVRDAHNRLIPDDSGAPFRLWRLPLTQALNPDREAWAGIHHPNDIWNAINRAAYLPGTTPAARLQPISARMVMLQSGIRAPMGIRVMGPDLETIQRVSIQMEDLLRQVPSISPGTVIADRVLGKPYLEIDIDRQAIAQYGINLQRVLDVIEFSIGGKRITTTVEGRERYSVRVRYARELRDNLESLGRVLVPSPAGPQIPLMQLAQINYTRGPQSIKGENTFLVGYILFDKLPGFAEVDVVEAVRRFLEQKIDQGELVLPLGVSYSFTGTYENQIRSVNRLSVILPVSLIIIFLLLLLKFNRVTTSLMVFAGIAVAWAGGFVMIWLYGQSWFLDFSVLGVSMRDMFQVHPINLSVAVWVGFLALFGIATDDGVLMATYLDTTFSGHRMDAVETIRRATIEASLRRIRPCLMTTATTVIALIPVLTATGRGADIMVPMAIPTFGGMLFEVVTVLVVPVLYCWREELHLAKRKIQRIAQSNYSD